MLNTATCKIYGNPLKNSVNNYYVVKETTSSPYAQMRGSHFDAQKLLHRENAEGGGEKPCLNTQQPWLRL